MGKCFTKCFTKCSKNIITINDDTANALKNIHTKKEDSIILPQSKRMDFIKYQSNYYKDIQESYTIKEIISRSSFGTMKKASLKNSAGIKEYAIQSFLKSQVNIFENELETYFLKFNHPNVLKFYEVYEDDQYIHIVMDICTGGWLLENLTSRDYRYTEGEVIKIMYCLLNAINCLHKSNIPFRYLKLENIFFHTLEDLEIKIIPVSVINKNLNDSLQKTLEAYYMPPELINNHAYKLPCDIWRCGIILFILLSGNYPFNGENANEIYEQILRNNYNTNDSEWKNISNEAKDFIKLLLNPNNSGRITAEGALENQWFKVVNEYECKKINKKTIKNLKKHAISKKILTETMNLLMKTLGNDGIIQLNNIFKGLDKGNKGFINTILLEQGIISLGLNLEGNEIQSN